MGQIRVVEMDIAEIIRQIRAGESNRQIADRLDLSKTTVGRYRDLLTDQQLRDGTIPVAEIMKTLMREKTNESMGPVSTVEPYRETVIGLLEQQVSKAVILQRLRDRHGYTGSYSSVMRFVRTLEVKQPEVFARMEVEPGKQAQVDFGSAGKMWDPLEEQLRKAWAFVMTLSHSRHQFVKFVFDQKTATWLALHREAFSFFDGVPAEIVVDNLKSAIVLAALYDPQVQRGYRECALHYGFLISPCRPNTPEHKGKVEAGGVKYVKNNFLAGQAFRDINQANEQVLTWCLETAGKRIHGTTKQVPLEVFLLRERQALLPLPRDPYQLAIWRECALHPDGHIVFEQSYYSAPFHLVGKKLLVRATTLVEIFHEHKVVRTHTRAIRKGERKTHPDDVPPEKMAFFTRTPTYCREQARRIGPATEQVVTRLLDERPLNHLRAVQGILRMKEAYSPQRLEAACARVLAFNELSYKSIRRILLYGYDTQRLPGMEQLAVPTRPAKPPIFTRDWTEFLPDTETTQQRCGDHAHAHDTSLGTDAAIPAPERDSGDDGDSHSGSR